MFFVDNMMTPWFCCGLCLCCCWRDIPGVTTRALLMMASRYQSLLTTHYWRKSESEKYDKK